MYFCRPAAIAIWLAYTVACYGQQSDDEILSRISTPGSEVHSSLGLPQVPRAYRFQKEVLDRIGLNMFLRTLRPAYAIQNGINDEQLSKLGEVLKGRHLRLQRAADEMAASLEIPDDRIEDAIAKLLREDEQDVENIATQLSEILTPHQTTSLLRTYLANETDWGMFDPLARRWLGLTLSEVVKMKHMRDEASAYLRAQFREHGIQSSNDKLPVAIDQKYREKLASMWAHLPAEKIERILRARGLIRDEEGIDAFVERSPRERDALLKIVPAFAQAVSQKSTDNK